MFRIVFLLYLSLKKDRKSIAAFDFCVKTPEKAMDRQENKQMDHRNKSILEKSRMLERWKEREKEDNQQLGGWTQLQHHQAYIRRPKGPVIDKSS